MIPEEVLADNPAILEKIVELSARRICRLCLGDVDSLVEIDVVWKMKIVSCFPMVTVGSARLPKYICEPCGKFVKKCYEFRQLCRKAEQMLVNYPLTGSWSGELAIPRWLREEGQQEQVGTGRKRKFAGDLVSSQVGSVRVRSHVSMAMSLQSPTITPGVMEQIDERSQESQIDSQPTGFRQLEQPTITPTTHQPHYKVPVIQSASQPVSSQHSPSTQLRNPATNITPVSQPPQKIQRTNSIPSLPQLILHPGYTMQQHTPQLVSRPQIQSSNANLNNMVQMLSQLTSLPQPAVQQQQLTNQIPTNYTQSNFLLTTPGYQQPQYTSIQQPSIVMTPTRSQNLSTFQNNQLPQIVMTPTQNPQMTPTYQQPLIPMTPTRTQYPSMYQNNQLPQIAMTPTRVQNPQMTPTYQQSQIATTPTVTQNLPTLQHLLQTSTAKTTTPNNKQPTGIWCHVCDFQFLTVEHYKFHLRKHNPNPIGDLTSGLRPQLKTCRLCTAKAFPTHADLLHHMRAHESVGLSKACDFCVKIFADERHRSEHFRKHHGDVLERTLKLNGQ